MPPIDKADHDIIHVEYDISFKSEVLVAIERFIPTKLTKTKYSLPWIDHSIKRLIRKREKLYFRARKPSSPDIKNHYKRFRAHVRKAIRDAYWKHLSISSPLKLMTMIPIAREKMKHVKGFAFRCTCYTLVPMFLYFLTCFSLLLVYICVY